MGRDLSTAEDVVSGRDVTRLGLGTAQFGLDYGVSNVGGRVEDRELRQLLGAARGSRISLLDTAVAYGDSETRIGALGMAGWDVVSKLPELPTGISDVQAWVTEHVNGSLRRLREPCLYGLLLHRPADLLGTAGESLYRALEREKRDGRVARIGLSIYAPEELEDLTRRFAIDLVQAPINILDRRMLDSGWLSRLAEFGVEVHARSVFLQGLLLFTKTQRPARFARWNAVWTIWDSWLEWHKLSPIAACVRYALSLPHIARVIVGVTSSAQLTELVAATDGPLPDIPASLRTDDIDLLNPSRWETE